jgi:hypothetical protein
MLLFYFKEIFMRGILAILGGLVLVVALIVGMKFLGFNMWAYFAPKEAQVEREVFENTKGYNDGMLRDLENLMMEYQKAPKDQKAALKDVVLHRFSVYPTERLPSNLRSFYTDLKGEAQ